MLLSEIFQLGVPPRLVRPEPSPTNLPTILPRDGSTLRPAPLAVVPRPTLPSP